MSDIRVNSIAGANGTSPATLVKQSAAKAWANLNGTGTIALRDSFNVSSVVDNGVGDYTHNFSNAFASTNYAIAGTSSANAGSGPLIIGRFQARTDLKTATQVAVHTMSFNGSNTDSTEAYTDYLGDLA